MKKVLSLIIITAITIVSDVQQIVLSRIDLPIYQEFEETYWSRLSSS